MTQQNKLYNELPGKPTYEELVRENERLRAALTKITNCSVQCGLEANVIAEDALELRLLL